jgi:type I restriction enzyme S subunit
VVPISTEKRSLFWVLKAVTAHVEDQAHGIIGMVHVTKGDLGAINVPVPSLPEQTQIAAFLDRETAKIDELVAEQRRLMELLKEKRQAVISHAVTRGLNPHAPLKPSGIEWLGDVPEHWEVSAIKRYAEKITDGAHVSPETENGVFHFVSTKDVGADSIDFENCLRTSEQSYESMVKTGCRPVLGDVLFSKDGTIGRTVVIREERDFVVASSLIIIRPTASILDSDFLNCLCQSLGIANQVDCFVKGAGLPRLSIQNLTKVVVCLPPISEQKAIAEFLESELAKFDTLTTEAQRAIALLQERRSALISAAVTGQIDVRGVV